MMNEERLLNIILAPHMSEKASIGTQKYNQYIFKVVNDANKAEIKIAIEHLFKTKVNKVRIVNVIAKARRFGQITGKKKGWKKAYVTLLEGQQIDFAGTSKI
jgi:large subunit ribosomal protein L23